MAKKDNKVNMPMSTAGITRYFEGYESALTIQPMQVIFLVIFIVILIIFLHMYGNAWFGI